MPCRFNNTTVSLARDHSEAFVHVVGSGSTACAHERHGSSALRFDAGLSRRLMLRLSQGVWLTRARLRVRKDAGKSEFDSTASVSLVLEWLVTSTSGANPPAILLLTDWSSESKWTVFCWRRCWWSRFGRRILDTIRLISTFRRRDRLTNTAGRHVRRITTARS